MVGMDLRGISIGISGISFLMNISVLFLLFWKGGRSRHTYLWASLMGLLTLWCFSEVFIKSTDETAIAIDWFRFVLIAGGLIPPLLLNFALEFPHRHKLIRKRLNRIMLYALIYVPNIILLIKAEVTSVFVAKVAIPETLWGRMYTRDSLIIATAPDVYIPHYIFLIGLIFVAIYFIFMNLRNAQSKTEKKQLEIIAWALSLMFIPGVIFDAVLSMVFGVYTEVFSLLVSILAVMTAYSIVRHKFLVIAPVSEEFDIDPENLPQVDPGFAYIVPESMRDTGIKMFRYTLSQKRDGIVITNKDPTDVRVDFGIKRTPIIYLGEKTNYKFHIDPGDLDGLVSSLSTFTGMTNNPVILIEWDLRPSGDTKGTALRKSSSDTRSMEQWIPGGDLQGPVEESIKILTGGSSMIIFQDIESKRILRTQRPTQQIKLMNMYLIKTILEKILAVVESKQGDPWIVLKELATVNKFFDGLTFMEGSLIIPLEKVQMLDRASTIVLLRNLQLVLSRSVLKGTSEAMDKVWKESNLGSYMVEEISVPEGTVHFIAHEDPSYTFNIAREMIAAGYEGLCISTRPPDKIQHLYGLAHIEYRWITTSRSDDKRSLPVSLEHIMRDIRDYLAKHDESLVIIDGIELLISRLGFENVQRFLHVLKDEIAVTKTRLIIPIDPRAIEEQRLALLKREVEV